MEWESRQTAMQQGAQLACRAVCDSITLELTSKYWLTSTKTGPRWNLTPRAQVIALYLQQHQQAVSARTICRLGSGQCHRPRDLRVTQRRHELVWIRAVVFGDGSFDAALTEYMRTQPGRLGLLEHLYRPATAPLSVACFESSPNWLLVRLTKPCGGEKLS